MDKDPWVGDRQLAELFVMSLTSQKEKIVSKFQADVWMAAGILSKERINQWFRDTGS